MSLVAVSTFTHDSMQSCVQSVVTADHLNSIVIASRACNAAVNT